MNVESKISVRGQTVIPQKVRDQLNLKAGDRVSYRKTRDGFLIEKVEREDDPFATFDEWGGRADEEAYADL